MAIAELDGAGGHTFRRVTLAPRNGRIISSNADAFHSADVDTTATLDHCHFRVSLSHMQCQGRKVQHRSKICLTHLAIVCLHALPRH